MWIDTLSQEVLDAGAQGPNTFLSKRLDAFIHLVQMMPLNGLYEDQTMPKRSAEIESLRRGGTPELHERLIETNDAYNKIIPDEKYFETSERTLVHTGVGAYKYNSIDDQELFTQYQRYKALKLTSVFDLTGGLLTTHPRKISAEKDPI